MATWLYRKSESGDVESVLIDAKYVPDHLTAGFVPCKSGVAAVEAPTEEEADTNNSGKLSTDEVREAAKTAGIKGWDTKRIKTLKSELGYGV